MRPPDNRLRFFVDKTYYPSASIFRLMQDWKIMRVIVRIAINYEGMLELNGKTIEILKWGFGPPDRYEPRDILMTLHNLKKRRAWLSMGWEHFGERLFGYVECWTDDWEGNLL